MMGKQLKGDTHMSQREETSFYWLFINFIVKANKNQTQLLCSHDPRRDYNFLTSFSIASICLSNSSFLIQQFQTSLPLFCLLRHGPFMRVLPVLQQQILLSFVQLCHQLNQIVFCWFFLLRFLFLLQLSSRLRHLLGLSLSLHLLQVFWHLPEVFSLRQVSRLPRLRSLWPPLRFLFQILLVLIRVRFEGHVLPNLWLFHFAAGWLHEAHWENRFRLRFELRLSPERVGFQVAAVQHSMAPDVVHHQVGVLRVERRVGGRQVPRVSGDITLRLGGFDHCGFDGAMNAFGHQFNNMAERGHALKQDISKLAWEETDFPIVCASCLGDCPYIRMLKDRFGKECRICARPYTTFKWKPSHNQRQKMTEICQTCGKIKNICQVCLKDLEYHMGMCTRDKFLGDKKIEIPEHTANRDYWAEQANRHIERLILPYNQKLPMLDQIMNEPRLADVNKLLKEEREGVTEAQEQEEEPDPNEVDLLVREKFEAKGLLPPEDPKICSLYVSHMTAEIKESDLKHKFQDFGKIHSIKMMEHGQSCFINFSKRKSAEKAINALYNNLFVKDVELKIQWARPSSKRMPLENLLQSIRPEHKKVAPPQLPPQHLEKREQKEDELLMSILGKSMNYPSQDPYQKGGQN